jgi:methylglutaconyl-CoA hydratase
MRGQGGFLGRSMDNHECLVLEKSHQGAVVWMWLNRPHVKNALNGALIDGLSSTVQQLGRDSTVRAIVLAGRGDAFCAGADLGYMQAMGQTPALNEQASLALGAVFRHIAQCPKPVVARVHGVCFAGALGLVCASDIVVASSQARFCLPEVRRGLIPATISPFVLQAMGARAAQRYFLTAEVFDAACAQALGMVHECSAEGDLDARVHSILDALLAGAPQAQAQAKRLIQDVQGMAMLSEATHQALAKRLSDVRAGDEAAEGMRAFLEKREAEWVLK